MSSAAPLQNQATKSPPRGGSAHRELLLQRKCVCGSPTQSMCDEYAEFQDKNLRRNSLSMGVPDDRSEQEANRVAAAVMAGRKAPMALSSGPSGNVQHEEGPMESNAASSIVSEVLRSPGEPLSAETRAFMEPRFGVDFSRVRVHSSAAAEQSARQIGAHAYTVGSHIVFGAGADSPHVESSREILAHELTHVVQQSRASGPKQIVQRKLALQSAKVDLEGLSYVLKEDDLAKNFEKKPGTPTPIVLKPKYPGPTLDAFRFKMVETILQHPTETLILQQVGRSDPLPQLNLTNGKPDPLKTQTSLTELTAIMQKEGKPGTARGTTIPAQNLVSSTFTGPVTGVSHESRSFYEFPAALAHEIGHAFLLFSGKPWGTKQSLTPADEVKDPFGKVFTGPIEEEKGYLEKYVDEQPKSAPMLYAKGEGPHFSPTEIREWTEPGGSKFKGTFVEFRKKYPSVVLAVRPDPKDNKKSVFAHCVPPEGGSCTP